MSIIIKYSIATFLLTLYSCFKILKQSKHIFNIGIFFNVLLFLYGVIGLLTYSYVFNNEEKILKEIALIILLSSIAFNLTYLKTKPLKKINKVIGDTHHYISNIIFILCSFTSLFLLIYNDGLLVDRTDSFGVLYENKYIFLINSTISISYIQICFNYYFKNKKTFFYFSTLYLLIFSIISISRFDLFLVFVTNAYFLNKSNKISNKIIIIYSVLLLILFLFYKQILYQYVLNSNYNNYVADYGELINWLRNTLNVVNSYESYNYQPYYITIEGIINPFINSDKALTNWYMNTFHYDKLLAGNKYGFSFIGESYLAGGFHLLIFVFAFYGYLFKKISFIKLTKTTTVIQVIIMISLYKLFRSESYNFFRSIVWSYLIPLCLIQTISSFLNEISKKIHRSSLR